MFLVAQAKRLQSFCIPNAGGLDEKWTEPSVEDFENEIKINLPSGSHIAPCQEVSSISKYHSLVLLRANETQLYRRKDHNPLCLVNLIMHTILAKLTSSNRTASNNIILHISLSYVLSHNRTYRNRSRSSRQRPRLRCPCVCFPKAKGPITVIGKNSSY